MSFLNFGLRAPIDTFFDQVTVNAPEAEVRARRLALFREMLGETAPVEVC